MKDEGGGIDAGLEPQVKAPFAALGGGEARWGRGRGKNTIAAEINPFKRNHALGVKKKGKMRQLGGSEKENWRFVTQHPKKAACGWLGPSPGGTREEFKSVGRKSSVSHHKECEGKRIEASTRFLSY